MSRHRLSPSTPSLARRALGVLLVLLVVGSLFVLPVSAAEDPRFETSVPEPELQPGATQTLTVTLTNDAADVDDEVKPASNVKVTAKSGSTPIEVASGERQLGRLADGESTTVDLGIEVPASAPGGTYHLPLAVTYEYDGDERETETVTARVVIPERPIFAIESVDVDLHPGETGTVTLTMANDGSQPARNASVALSSQHAALTVGGEARSSTFLGTLEPGDTARATVAVTATRAALAQPYDLQVAPSYRNANGITTQTPTRTIGVAPAETTRFGVAETTGTVSPGETGTVELTLENRGETTLSEAVLRLEPTGSGLTLDGAKAATHFVGEWAPTEERTVSVAVGAAESVSAGSVPIRATLAFEHPAGIQSESGPIAVGIPVTAVEVFEYSDVFVTHTGPGPVLSATVTNTGEQPIENAVVALTSRTPGVQVTDGWSAVGTLGTGESTTVSAELRVAGDDRTSQSFEVQVRYAGEGGQAARSETTTIWAELATAGDLFTVEPVNNTFDLDSSNELRVRITNEGTESFEDIRASLTAQPPYQSQSPTAYVASLEPGESAVVAFEVTTPEDGIETTDTLALNLTAETETDRTVVDGPHLVPITVDGGGETTGSSILIAGLAVVVIGLLGGGWWWLNR
ncbi:MAG: NEW3 domain-containing protein [Halodesulfurarchaeum sp.]|nr:NEW3 domain-containing protein [Halodesulfurarchaeum sp.]